MQKKKKRIVKQIKSNKPKKRGFLVKFNHVKSKKKTHKPKKSFLKSHLHITKNLHKQIKNQKRKAFYRLKQYTNHHFKKKLNLQ